MLNFLFIIAKLTQSLTITVSILILLKEKICFNKKFVSLLSGVIVSFFITFLIRDWDIVLKTFIIFMLILLYYLLIVKIYKTSSILGITTSLLVFTISGIHEGLILLYTTNFCNCDYNIVSSINLPRIIVVLTICLLNLFIIHIINIILIKKISKDFLESAAINLLFLLAIVTILFWPQLLYLTENQFKTAFVFSSISFIELALISMVSIQKFLIHSIQIKTAADLKSEKIYNQTLKSAVDTIRGFKHDYNNIINTLNGYIILNDMEGLKNYFNEGVLKDTYKLKSLEHLSFDLINDSGIYNLIASKYFECNTKNITMTLDITSDIKSLNIPNFELSRILGILLDNAIEASLELEPKDRKIVFRLYRNYNLNLSKIVIENTFNNNKDINTENVFLKDFSTKKNPSGFGLYEVKKIIKSFDNISIETDIKNNKFKQTLIIQD